MRATFGGAIAHALGATWALTGFAPLPAIGEEVAGVNHVAPGEVVTGTHIPTVEGATALPIQIITRHDIERANIQTAVQLFNTLSAATSYSTFNEARGLGNGMAGFAASATECEHVKQLPQWTLEGIAFYVRTPGANGKCADGSSPVYRLYNNGLSGAPNHVYTPNVVRRDQLVGAGWIGEGTSWCVPAGVVF